MNVASMDNRQIFITFYAIFIFPPPHAQSLNTAFFKSLRTSCLLQLALITSQTIYLIFAQYYHLNIFLADASN